MSLRCGCPNDGDSVVFGPNHRCDHPEKADLPALVPSWVFTVPAEQPVLRDPYDMDDDERRGT